MKNFNGVRFHLTGELHGLPLTEAKELMSRSGIKVKVKHNKKAAGEVKKENNVPEVTIMSEENSNEVPAREEGPSVGTGHSSSVTVNDVINFRGLLRQFATRLSEAEGKSQFQLLPQKEFLKYAQERLAKETVPVEEFVLIRDAFEDEHGPIIDGILGPMDEGLVGPGRVSGKLVGPGRGTGGTKISSSQDLEIKKSRLLSRTRDLQKMIHTQPETERNRLDVELTILRDMSRRIVTEALGDEDLDHIEGRINNEVQPHLDAVVQTSGGGQSRAMGGGMDDFLEQTQNGLEQEFRIKRLRRQIKEEDTDTDNNQKSGSETIMVQAMQQSHEMALATMEQGKQDNGGASASDVMVQAMKDNSALLLASMASKGDNGTTALLVQAMQQSHEMMMEQMRQNNDKKDDGPSSWEMMTQMIGLLNQQNQQDPNLQLQLETIRQDAASARQETYNTQLGFMNQKVTELQGALQRDPFDDFLHQKERMKAMGMWNDGATSVEEKTITEVTGLGREALNNFSGSMNTFAGVLAPLVQTYAENLRPQTPPPQQPRLDDTAKLERYKALLGNVDEAIEATTPQQDRAPLPGPGPGPPPPVS